MSTNTPVSTANYGNKVLSLGAQIGILIIDSRKKDLLNWTHGIWANIAENLPVIVEKNFPINNLESRMAKGPIVGFLTNAQGDIIKNLDAGTEYVLTCAEGWLKTFI